jgi:hypothetical protein
VESLKKGASFRVVDVVAEMDDPQEVVRALISLAKDIENMTLHHPRLLMTRAEEILSHIRR